MRYIEPPHLILRKHLIHGERVSSFAVHVAQYSSKTLFNTSLVALEGGVFRSAVAAWSKNTAMCALTEKVIFTDPYTVSPFNRWTTPQLDTYALSIKEDQTLKLAVAKLKEKFLSQTQALLHGDLHSGSVMATEGSTFIIDPEFAFYGPIGFDIGAFVSNLFLNYFSAFARGDAGCEYAEFVLAQTVLFYETFVNDFVALWREARSRGDVSELFPLHVYNSDELFEKAVQAYTAQIYKDTLGFTGLKMIRRIVGIAHVEDLESIQDPEARSVCEKRALLFARKLVLASQESVVPAEYSDIRTVTVYARTLFAAAPSDKWPL